MMTTERGRPKSGAPSDARTIRARASETGAERRRQSCGLSGKRPRSTLRGGGAEERRKGGKATRKYIRNIIMSQNRKVGEIVKKVGIKQLTNAFFHGKINSAEMRKGCISPFLHLFCGLDPVRDKRSRKGESALSLLRSEENGRRNIAFFGIA